MPNNISLIYLTSWENQQILGKCQALVEWALQSNCQPTDHFIDSQWLPTAYEP